MFVLLYLDNGIPKIPEDEFLSVKEAETYIEEKGIKEFKIIPNCTNEIDFSKGVFDKGYH